MFCFKLAQIDDNFLTEYFSVCNENQRDIDTLIIFSEKIAARNISAFVMNGFGPIASIHYHINDLELKFRRFTL